MTILGSQIAKKKKEKDIFHPSWTHCPETFRMAALVFIMISAERLILTCLTDNFNAWWMAKAVRSILFWT